LRVALLAKIRVARCLFLGRFSTARILLTFDASDADVVALHLLRTVRPRAKITVAHLKGIVTRAEVETFIADLRIRWSLEMLTVDFRQKQDSCVLGDDEFRNNAGALQSMICAAREADCEVICTAWPARSLLLRRGSEAPVGLKWIDPTWCFTDKDFDAYIDHFRLPVCRLGRRMSQAPMPIASNPEVLERMRGLGYF
jgi:hypothetical protein